LAKTPILHDKLKMEATSQAYSTGTSTDSRKRKQVLNFLTTFQLPGILQPPLGTLAAVAYTQNDTISRT